MGLGDNFWKIKVAWIDLKLKIYSDYKTLYNEIFGFFFLIWTLLSKSPSKSSSGMEIRSAFKKYRPRTLAPVHFTNRIITTVAIYWLRKQTQSNYEKYLFEPKNWWKAPGLWIFFLINRINDGWLNLLIINHQKNQKLTISLKLNKRKCFQISGVRMLWKRTINWLPLTRKNIKENWRKIINALKITYHRFFLWILLDLKLLAHRKYSFIWYF